MLIFTILHVILQSSVLGKFYMLIFTNSAYQLFISHQFQENSAMLIFKNSAYQFQKNYSIYNEKKKKTSPNIDGFYKNCSCISMYISCISSKTNSQKSAPSLLSGTLQGPRKLVLPLTLSIENVMESAHC